ncbi:MAG TPA: sensor histidine kinase [Spirochaetia bacterium]|nr:sensor histidine kinase [Spirochaetia bacterium]
MKIRRIQDTLIRAFAALIVVALVLLGTLSYYYLHKILIQNAEETTMQLVSQLNRIIENYIHYMDDIALMAVSNEDVRAFIASPRADTPALRTKIESTFESIRAVRRDIDSVFVLTRDGRAIAATIGGALNPTVDLRRRFLELEAGVVPGHPSVSSAHVENLVDYRYPWVISLVRTLPAGPAGWSLGLIQVDLNYDIIARLCKDIQLGDSGYVFILGRNGDIVYHPRQQLIYGSLKTEKIPEILSLSGGNLRAVVDGRQILYTAVSSRETGWEVVAVSYLDALFRASREAEYVFLMLSLLVLVGAVGAGVLISSRISEPIESLRRSMQAVESGNFEIDITVNARNEVYQLARDCDIAVKKVRDLIEQNRREQELKRGLELRALQAQINPHFLYNTLDSIIWMIELGEADRAIDMTSSLARFFRIGISRGEETISVRTEIEYVQTYLEIQKQRYKDKLTYEIAFSPELYDHQILKLLIQPLVENAIYHGIKNLEGPGSIRITGEREGDSMVIRIRDNGVGMEADQLAALRGGLIEPGPANGVGVRNVLERIHVYFGLDYGLGFESSPGAGTVATLRIPLTSGGRA